MALDTYLWHICQLAVALVPIGFAAGRVRRRLLPTWTGGIGLLAGTVLGLSLFLALLQGLGAVGLFRTEPVILTCAVVGAAVFILVRPSGVAHPAHPVDRGHRERGVEVVGALVVMAVLAGEWVAGVLTSLRNGITDVDSLHYHLSFAARFVQTGSLTGIHFTRASAPAPSFYPANSELLHGFGMLVMRSDILSPVVNLAWLGLALLATWCIGRQRGSGALALIGLGILFAAPVMALTQAGTADNDIASLALMLAAAAALLADGVSPSKWAVSGMAAGLAVATKLTMLAPVGGLAILVAVLTIRSRRLSAAGWWAAGGVATGSFWYVRNLVRTGNPVPAFRAHLGPLRFPSPPSALVDRFGYSVAHYLTDVHAWRHSFLPGLRQAIGLAWPAVLLLVALALVLELARPATTESRGVALIAVGAACVYLVLPTTAFGRDGQPILFAVNLRYAAPAASLALALVPRLLVSTRVRRIATLSALVVTFGLTIATRSPWAAWPSAHRGAFLLVVVAVMGAALVPVALDRRGHSGREVLRVSLALAAAAVVSIVCALGFVQHSYLRSRYRSSLTTIGPAYRWAAGVHGARIGVVGFFTQYPLTGTELSNFVQYVGQTGSHGAFAELASCREWRAALLRGRYDYVVIAPSETSTAGLEARGVADRARAWTADDPAAMPILDRAGLSIFRITQSPDPAGCP